MACDSSALLSANPFVALSDGQKLAAECRMIQEWTGSTEDISTILGRAYDFVGLSEGEALAVEAKLLSVIAGEDNPSDILLNSRFITLDDGLRDCAKLKRLYELSGQSGDIDSLFLNNKFLYADRGLAIAAKLRLLADIAYGVGVGSASTALLYNPFYNLSDGLTKCCINELLCLASSGIADEIQAVVTQTGTSATENLSLSNEFDAIRVWTGETPVTEPWFFLYVTRNGSTTKIKMNRFEARIVNVPGGSFGLATSNGRTVYIAPDAKPSALGTSFPVSGTANADAGGPPIWSPSAAHITLPVGQSQYELVGSGTERIVFVSEYDGATWSPARWLRLPASGSVRMHATYRQIALANYDGATVSVNGPTGTVIGGTSAASSLTMPSVTGTTHSVSTVAQLKTAIGAAVAGDEIVLAAGTYNLDVNITAASFTSNNGVGGRVGMEGILIRGATSDRTLYVIGCAANSQGDWSLTQPGASLVSGFKDLTFVFSGSNNSNIAVNRGRWAFQNVRFTGATVDTIEFIGSSSSSNGIFIDLYRCQADTGSDDLFNGDTGGGTGTNQVRIIDCTAFIPGASTSAQCITSHNGLGYSVYGGSYYDAAQNVIANSSSAVVASLFWVNTSRGTRQGGIQHASLFGCNFGQAQTAAVTLFTVTSYIIGTRFENTVRESAATNSSVEGNLFTNALGGTVNAYFPNVSTSTTFERNVCLAFGTAIRMDTGAGPGTMSANRNTMVSCATACDTANSTFTKSINGNISKSSSTRSINTNAVGMANTFPTYNVWDGVMDVDYIAGSNDLVATTPDIDSNYFPTASGNCDGTGNPAAIDWVGGTDHVGFLLEISDVTRDRGARCRPRIITGAALTPDIW